MEHLLAAIDQREGEVFTPMIGAASSSSLSISSPTFNDEDSRNLPSNDCYDRRYHFAMTHEQQSTFTGSGTTATATASVDRGITWQEMFQQLKDFRELRHHRIPPRLDRWMNAQRRQYSMYGIGTKQPTGIITNRIRQLNSIGFEWNVGVSSECFTQPPLPTPPPPSSQSKHSFNDHCIRTWTEEEDEAILRLQMQWGNAWKKIATELNTGRSESKVRHRWLALDRMGRRSYISTDDDSGRCMDMDIESEDEAVVEEVIEIDDDDDIDEQDNAQYEVDKNVVQSCEFTVDHDRTDHVERLVKDALKRERRPRGAVKSRTAVTPKKSSGRIRKPSRRVQESYLTLGSNSSSSYNNNSEGEEYCMQSNDALAVGCSSDRHDNNSSQGLNRHLHGSQRPESIRTTSKREQFPETLFRMVNTCSETEPHIIKWVPDGSAFQVKDISLIPAVLHRYFRHSNYVSFNRMLQLYGFNRHTTGRQLVDEFHHPYFTRSSSRDSLVSFVTKCTEAPPPLGNTIPLKSMKVKVGEGCGKGFSSDIVATDLPRRNVNTNGVKNTVAPNSNDVLMSLKNHEYKQVMFDYFKMLGVKDGADDNDTVRRRSCCLPKKYFHEINIFVVQISHSTLVARTD
jgi:hypothetical protein